MLLWEDILSQSTLKKRAVAARIPGIKHACYEEQHHMVARPLRLRDGTRVLRPEEHIAVLRARKLNNGMTNQPVTMSGTSQSLCMT
jgi:hypothetical protein